MEATGYRLLIATEEKKTEGLADITVCVCCVEDGAEVREEKEDEEEGGGGGDGPWRNGGWVGGLLVLVLKE